MILSNTLDQLSAPLNCDVFFPTRSYKHSTPTGVAQRMSDTLQFVVRCDGFEHNRNGSTDVRYASACREVWWIRLTLKVAF